MLGILDPRNVCGQRLLGLVARGNAIIAELFRLSHQIPPVLLQLDGDNSLFSPGGGGGGSGHGSSSSSSSGQRPQQKDPPGPGTAAAAAAASSSVLTQAALVARYRAVIFDFSYFKSQDSIERTIEANAALREADDEFRENFLPIIERLYVAFEAIHRYADDLNRLVEELEDGHFLAESLEVILEDQDGRQLAAEAVYLMGVMLLVVDERYDSRVRERILVANYRHSSARSASPAESHIDDVCNLLRSTGLNSASSKRSRPAGYPENYFRRAALNPHLVSLVLGRLRSDDIYSGLASYPLPEHRSTALAGQAAMLYITLYFAPEVLASGAAPMREVVDKFFPDNWIVSVYMGRTINLIAAWEPYRAAREALSNTIDLTLVRQAAAGHYSKLKTKLVPQLERLLAEGALTEEVVLENSSKLLTTLRQCNVTARWLILHSIACDPMADHHQAAAAATTKTRLLRDATFYHLLIQSGGGATTTAVANPAAIAAAAEKCTGDVLSLLLLTAELEAKAKDLFKALLEGRDQKLAAYRSEAVERLQELAQVFSGERPSLVVRVEKNSNLSAWFGQMSAELASVDLAAGGGGGEAASASSRKLVELVQAMQELEELHHVATAEVKSFLAETSRRILLMLRTLNIRPAATLGTLQVIGDLGYAWELMDSCFTGEMRAAIGRDPSTVLRLRSSFLKLSTALDLPLLRLQQAASPDLVGVSRFYSSELVAYVRNVLQVIPETLFELMGRIVELQTSAIRELPTRLMKDQLRSYAQLEERSEVAALTASIAVFAEGLLAMRTTLVGIIQIDAARLLEDGIRRELVKQVSAALHRVLTFDLNKSRSSTVADEAAELTRRLSDLADLMSGFRRSFEYIQDYVCVYGLKIWREEFWRAIFWNVEQECNVFLGGGGGGRARTMVHDWESVYQSRTVPIPAYPPTDPVSVTYVGRLARALLRVTSPARTIYVDGLGGWYDARRAMAAAAAAAPDHLEPLVDRRTFEDLLMRSVDVAGLNGLDRLFSFMITGQLNEVLRLIRREINDRERSPLADGLDRLEDLLRDLQEVAALTSNQKILQDLLRKGGRQWTAVWEAVLKIGQLQILRGHIAFALVSRCQFQSRQLSACLRNFNGALLATLSSAAGRQDVLKAADSPLLYELGQYLDYSGLASPLEKVYTAERRPPDHLVTILWISLTANIHRLSYIRSVRTLSGHQRPQPRIRSSSAADAADGHPLLIGCLTLLRQWPPEGFPDLFAQLLGLQVSHVIQSTIPATVTASKAAIELSPEAISWLTFFDEWRSFTCGGSGGGGESMIMTTNPVGPSNRSVPVVDYLADSFHGLSLGGSK